MKIVEIFGIKRPDEEVAQFQGVEYGANVSFFVVQGPPGKGPDKHRHPYEETFIILDGSVEFIVGGEMQVMEDGKIVILPTNTWHEFKNRSSKLSLMINIYPVSKMITEWA